MKKIIILALAMTFIASSAFATALAVGTTGGLEVRGAVASGTTSGSGGQPIARLSTNVVFSAEYATTGYALATYHLSGTKAYGTGYDSTKIYWNQIGENATLPTPSSSVSTDAFASWTEM